MTALLTDEEITNEAMGHCDNASKLRVDDFETGARFARDFYEAREKLWREYMKLMTEYFNPAMGRAEILFGVKKMRELRLALGIDKEGGA